MKAIQYFLLAALLAAPAFPAFADEGMWMIQDINAALEKNMRARGLKLAANEIYNADASGTAVSDAIVSLGFYCTGSVISSKGLVITNHHCAYSNISKLSTPEHNYLEEGFWAMSSEQEIPVPGEKVFFLKRVIDVTAEAKAMEKEYESNGQHLGSRKLGYLLEKKYNEETGMECIMNSMWTGEKIYISAYKVYDDLRLVAAPPVCIGYFGGEEDNWEWPRHNCDFTIYRIYENGRPVTSEKHLKVSLSGYKPGGFAMVIGYPASTDRYASSAEIDHQEKIGLPYSNKMRGCQMEIIRKWMDTDDEVRRKYSDWFFGLCNVQENNTGMVTCYRRFNVKEEKEAQEVRMQEWIDAAPNRKEMWGTLIPDLKKAYRDYAGGEKDKIFFRETVFRGTFISRYLMRAKNAKDVEAARKALLAGIAETDPRVEKELLAYAAKQYFSNLDSYYFGDYQQKLLDRFGKNWEAMADYLWNSSLISSEDKVNSLASLKVLENDPLKKFLTEVSIVKFNERNDQTGKWNEANRLEREYKKALYWMKLHEDVPQYPDANSTMRIAYGTVGGYEPDDGIWYTYYTTTDGILQKHDPARHDFNLNARQKSLLEKGRWGRWGCTIDGRTNTLVVDFLTNNDITGGNSGSPVLNANGNLIGLAFDGNFESLASDASYTQSYNKCINTDIRFVMWVLDKYAGMKHLLKELEFTRQ